VELKLTEQLCPGLPQRWKAWNDGAGQLQRQQVSLGHHHTPSRACSLRRKRFGLVVPFGTLDQIEAGFEALPTAFCLSDAGKGLVVEAVSVEAVVAGDAPAEPRHHTHEPREVPSETVRMYSAAIGTMPRGGA